MTLPNNSSRETVELSVLLDLMWRRGLLIGAFAIVGAIGLGIHAFFAERIYRADALVTVAEGDAMSATPNVGAVGALASLAGLNLGGGSNKRAEFVALLTSREVIAEMIETRNLTGELLPDRSVNADATSPADQSVLNDATTVFLRDVLSVSDNPRTGLIVVQVEWKDRFKAAEWTNDIVSVVNEKARRSAISEAEKTLGYLKRELAQVDVLAVRESIYRLVEANLSRIAVAKVREQFALRVIDPAVVPNAKQYVRPRRLVEPVVGFFFGILLGALLALFLERQRLWTAR